ncbi:MAG: hypothetical protein U0S49_03665 [Rhodospirillales bacterium]|nr:hypothetical protein [Rhodospirillales bacterium]
MQRKIDIGEAVKVAALCLPPVILSVIGLAAMGRKPHRPAVASRGTPDRGTRVAADGSA